jgi:hypothetical protein
MTKKNEPTLFDDDELSRQELPTEAAGTRASEAKKIPKISPSSNPPHATAWLSFATDYRKNYLKIAPRLEFRAPGLSSAGFSPMD